MNKTIEKEYDRPRLLAEKQAIITALESKKKQSNYIIWVLIGVSMLILVMTIRFYYLQHQYKTRFNELIQNRAQEKEQNQVVTRDPLEGISEHIITSILNQLKTFEESNY